jgi:hypothetical protein
VQQQQQQQQQQLGSVGDYQPVHQQYTQHVQNVQAVQLQGCAAVQLQPQELQAAPYQVGIQAAQLQRGEQGLGTFVDFDGFEGSNAGGY